MTSWILHRDDGSVIFDDSEDVGDEEQTAIIPYTKNVAHNKHGPLEDKNFPLTWVLHRNDCVLDYNPTTGVDLSHNPIFHLTSEHEKWCKTQLRDGYKLFLLRRRWSMMNSNDGEIENGFHDYPCIQFNSDRDFIIYKLFWQ